MHILWVIAKLFLLLSLAPALGVLVGFPTFLLSERIKILWVHRPLAVRDDLVSLAPLG